MTIGALAGAAVSFYTGNPWIAFLCAGIAGGVFALLHAVAAVTFRADQNVSGIALNMLGPGLALFLARLMWDGGTQSPSIETLPKIFGRGAFAGTPWANLNVDVTVVFGIIAAAVVWFVLYKTKWGLRVRAVGEHPAAADTLGINVSRTRFICVVLSGVMAGFGGASITLAIISQFTQTAVAGQGFIALAAVIFGKWTPHGAFGACLLFGMAQALVIILGGGVVPIPSEILAIMPYIARLMWDGGTQSPSIETLPKIFGRGAFAGTPWANLNVDVTVVFGIIAAAVVWFVLYKTKWGLRVRAVGEHPAAADTLGINVSRTRFICVVLSGVMAGFGGASITLAIISQFTQTAVAGQGFIALAAVIFGKWTPHGAFGACLLFGMAQALVIILGGGVVPIPSEILAIMPYILTLVVLVLFVGRSVAPKADGVPYEKGSRG